MNILGLKVVRKILSRFFNRFEDTPDLIINRSTFKSGLYCDLLFWLLYKDKDYTDNQFNNFQPQYFTIEKLYHSLFPEHLSVRSHNKDIASKITKELLKSRKPLLNASFLYKDLFTKCDVLLPSEDGGWDIALLKQSQSVKKNHLYDLSFQKYVLEKNKIKVNRCYVYSINSKYCLDGELDVSSYFIRNEATEKVKLLSEDTITKIDYFREVLKSKTIPQKSLGHSCQSPKYCNHSEKCWKDIGDGDIFLLREGKDTSIKLFYEGIRYMKDIPSETELLEKQLIQINSHKNNTQYVHKEKLKEFLNKITYPIYFLDFETINPNLPIFQFTKPFQHIPFLFSLHIQKEVDSPIEHISYISKSNLDPRKDILEILSKSISSEGSIVCYNDTLEKKCIRESAAIYKEYEPWYKSIANNFIDISIPFRNFYFYSPKQKGRASLKGILPALTDLNYNDLEVHDGQIANNTFLHVLTSNTSEEEKEKALSNLLEYCKMDSLALVEVYKELKKLTLNHL